MATTSEIRKKYLEFFGKEGHKVIPSASLVPENDPTTLFTGSGMQPLVPYLLGKNHPLGSFSGTSEADGITLCPSLPKNSRYFFLISDVVAMISDYTEAAVKYKRSVPDEGLAVIVDTDEGRCLALELARVEIEVDGIAEIVLRGYDVGRGRLSFEIRRRSHQRTGPLQ
jgi:hypothetical protein